MKPIFAFALATTLAVTVSAQVSDAGMRAIDTYREAIAAAQAGRPGSIERAYTTVSLVQETLLPDLPKLTDDAYALVSRQLRGLIVSRTGIDRVQPDATFYANMATARGDAADKAFFTALKATYPDSVWPVYVQRQTEAAGCVRFGSLTLVESYERWSAFKRRFPSRYASAIGEELEALHEMLTDGFCACGTVADVERELLAFNTRVPQSPIREEITSRLRLVRNGQSGIRASCRAQ